MSTRPEIILRRNARANPDLWSLLQRNLALREKDGGCWPEYVHTPYQVARKTVRIAYAGRPEMSEESIDDSAYRLMALSAWSRAKGVYTFDPTLYHAIVESPYDGSVSIDVLSRIPEPCLYIRTPGVLLHGRQVEGVFACIDHDPAEHIDWLVLVADTDFGDGLIPTTFPIGGSTIQETAFDLAEELVGAMAGSDEFGLSSNDLKAIAGEIISVYGPVISMLMYLCSEAPEIQGLGGEKFVRVAGRPGASHVSGQDARNGSDRRSDRNGSDRKVDHTPVLSSRKWLVGAQVGQEMRRFAHAIDIEASRAALGKSGSMPRVRRASWIVEPSNQGGHCTLRWMPPRRVDLSSD
jgi:hypothetical protein